MLRAFGANPTTMAFGDVPPALETKVIDGLLTSLGGFNKVKEQAPFYTIAGINGIVGDYYYIAGVQQVVEEAEARYIRRRSRKSWSRRFCPGRSVRTYCNDKRLIDMYGTKDPSKPGIYIMTSAESKALAD